ncbi:hypothetical protein E1A30_18495 [Salmonella enterica subsp. enterica serovar Newport]|nr:hypothetical protein [Salmonella enterica subsp. enterica serovar Newport]
MAKGKKKAATDSERQKKRRELLIEEFGPSVELHLSMMNKKRLNRIVKYMMNITDAEVSTRTRSIVIGELINSYYIKKLLKMKNEKSQVIYDVYNKLRKLEKYKNDPSHIAEILTKEGFKTPIKNGRNISIKDKKWTKDDVIYFSKSENVVKYILLSNKS